MNVYTEIDINLELTAYEASNLYHALLFIRELGGDTGDWYQQILNKLDGSYSIRLQPNKTYQMQLIELHRRIGYNALKK